MGAIFPFPSGKKRFSFLGSRDKISVIFLLLPVVLSTASPSLFAGSCTDPCSREGEDWSLSSHKKKGRSFSFYADYRRAMSTSTFNHEKKILPPPGRGEIVAFPFLFRAKERRF